VLAQCCRPVPGEEIVGYITRGRGISVHSVDCPNVRNLLYNPEREIEVAWAGERDDLYSVSLVLETEDRHGMLARLTDAIARLDTNIRQIEADTERPGRGNIIVVVDVRDRAHLERVRQALRNLPGVLEVSRRMTGAGSRAGLIRLTPGARGLGGEIGELSSAGRRALHLAAAQATGADAHGAHDAVDERLDRPQVGLERA
jgi:nitrate reductase NapAB chaperone NapD